MSELLTISPLLQAFLASLMTWGLTAAGAALVLFTRKTHPLAMDGMLAFGAGVMLASSYWSLLNPAVSLAGTLGQPAFLVAAAGFLCGGLLMMLSDALLNRCLPQSIPLNGSRRRSLLLIASITLHNIPEGLAVGVSFGLLASQPSAAALTAAWALALGIGLQNLPEGAAVSLPLRREGMRPGRAFFWGQLSAIPEPVAAVLGALLAVHVQAILPFALAFAAGAMVAVVIAELVPESQRSPHPSLMTFATLAGFIIMMALDVALG